MRQKVELGYLPQWEGPVKSWARKYLYKNKWRCDPILGMDDLEQEAFLLYMKLVDYYPAVREERHFISLFQTALRNQVHDYSRAVQKNRAALDNYITIATLLGQL